MPSWLVFVLVIWGVGSAILLICQGIETQEELGRGKLAFTRKEAVFWSVFWWVAPIVIFVVLPIEGYFLEARYRRAFRHKLED